MEKYIKNEGKFLVENGLLFRINQQILHPLGLALVIDTEPENRRKVSIRGVLETDDDEGWLYDPETFEEGLKKYEQFMKTKGQERIDLRKSALGFIIQSSGLLDEAENETDVN